MNFDIINNFCLNSNNILSSLDSNVNDIDKSISTYSFEDLFQSLSNNINISTDYSDINSDTNLINNEIKDLIEDKNLIEDKDLIDNLNKNNITTFNLLNTNINNKNNLIFDKQLTLSNDLKNVPLENNSLNPNNATDNINNTSSYESTSSIQFNNDNFQLESNDLDILSNLEIMKSFEDNTLIDIELESQNLLSNNEVSKEDIFNQVKNGMMSSLSGSKHIKMQLKPQGLGSVGINIRVVNGKINLEFMVDNSSVENVISENIKQLESILNSSGLLVINNITVKKRTDNKNNIFYNIKSKKEEKK